MKKSTKTYVTPDGRVVSWRWYRVPAVLWLIVVGSTITALILVGRVGYLLARQGPIQPGDDLNLTVFTLLLSGAGALVFSLVIYLLARPEEPDL
jgi:predicted small integral membrane protein